MAALDGMRVLDLTQWEAGPSCTQLLAWLGAEVVKVEPPSGDPGRNVLQPDGTPQYFFNYNANKQSFSVDLSSEAGRSLLLRLVEKFDVLVENLGPGVLERLGLDTETLRRHNPSLIIGRIKGFGLSGPHAGYNCYDWVAQAAAGALSVTGAPDGPPMRPSATMADSGSGVQMALAVVAAYVQKLRTNEGQEIELSMQEAATLFMRTASLRGWARSAAPRLGHRGVFRCLGGAPNDYVYIIFVTSAQWDALCVAIDQPELSMDSRFATDALRLTNDSALNRIIESWTMARTKSEAMEILAGGGVPCSAVLGTDELFTDPHLVERSFIHAVRHPVHGSVQLMGAPARMSRSEVPLALAPEVGEQTASLLTGELNLSSADIVELVQAGVIRTAG